MDERFVNPNLVEAMKLAAMGLNVSWEGLRRTEEGLVAANLTISADVVADKYNIYLSGDVIVLQFASTDRGRAELAARLLRLAGVSAEVKKEGGRDAWRVKATTDMLAAGDEKLRKALAEIVREAAARGWIGAGKAERLLKKLESGRVLREGWRKYEVGLADGTLVVKFSSTNPDNIEREAQRLKEMGLMEGRHFSVKMPEEGRYGYVYIRREGLAYAAWLSVHGSGRQRELAAEFVEYILKRAREEGEEAHEKVREIIEEGRARGFLKLEGFEKEV
jgi:hypothetical protein